MDTRALETAKIHQLPAGTQQRQAALEVAQQFEGIFVQSMVSAMRASAQVTGEGGGIFGNGPGADTYADWFDQNLARELSTKGRIGIADTLMRDFERLKQIEPAPRQERTAGMLARKLPAGGIDVAA